MSSKKKILIGSFLLLIALNPSESSLVSQINNFQPGKYGMNTITKVINVNKTNFLLFSIAKVSVLKDTPNPLYLDISSHYEETCIGFLGNWIELEGSRKFN